MPRAITNKKGQLEFLVQILYLFIIELFLDFVI